MSKWFDIIIPKEIIGRNVDYVSYTATPNEDADPGEKEASYKQTNCYAMYMRKLPKFTFKCVPFTKNSILSNEDYLKWMGWCMEAGLVPLASKFFINDDGQCAIIPGKGETKHRIYAALCCYRWSESLAPMVYTILRLMDAEKDIDFYQVLHYAKAKYITHYGHSFSLITSSRSLYGGGTNINLYAGLAMKFFFNRSYRKAEEANQTDMTQYALQTYEGTFGSSHNLKSIEQILDEKYRELYYFQPTQLKAIREFLNEKRPVFRGV